LGIKPDGIHVMKKLRTINEFVGEMTSPNTVEFCGGEFDVVTKEGEYEKGDKVKVKVKFEDVNLTDDEKDGVVGANVTQTLYKGNYNQVQVYTDTDEDFYVDTTDDWDINDRVGIKINPNKLILEKIIEVAEEE
ncbi:MAG: spermidine/putrescine ABC transporter ATP-binding protein, partial [Clostridia bacterium]|nr:spermidine/putrescine ABC transporter ATP-binding protein [Clostridia bacterium]